MKYWKYAAARDNRENMTPAEKKFWNLVNNKKFGVNFHRQKPIAGFIVDFWCPKKNLIIEIDGQYHLGRKWYDARRTFVLKKKGFRVERFSNDEVINKPDLVIRKLQNFIWGYLPQH